MAGLVPAIHVLLLTNFVKTWMPGTSPDMTNITALHLRDLAQHPRMHPPLRVIELYFLRRALRLGGVLEDRKAGSARPRHPRQPGSIGGAERRQHLADHRL